MISMIVAQDEERNIGFENKLLCRLSDDLKNFKNITTGKTVVMGRNTYESIGRPLPERENIVLSNRTEFTSDKDVVVTNDINWILKLSMMYPSKEFVVCGGESVYLQFLPYTSKIYLTQIHHTFENADTKFPQLFDTHWKLMSEEFHEADENNEYDFTIKEFKRKMVTCI